MTHRFSSNLPRKQSAFTLLEIMIVVTVIAVLIMLSTGAYQAAMQQTHAMRTASNMRPILSAFHDYALDHNDYFPPAYFPSGGGNARMNQTVRGEGRWLASTIFAQVYPDSSSSKDDSSADSTDSTTKDFNAPDGKFLKGTVFEVPNSVKAFPKEDNWFNHTFCLNAELITDSEGYQSGNPQFSPRKRAVFPDDANTMLIIEATEGDHNSITSANLDQLENAYKRYKGNFVHVGYMDGHVVRMKEREMYKSSTASDEASVFWTGVTQDVLRTKSGGANSNVKY